MDMYCHMYFPEYIAISVIIALLETAHGQPPVCSEASACTQPSS